MAKRYADALLIDEGASNPSGIAHAIVEACREVMSEPGYTGTYMMRRDPAVRLMVNQLSFLMGNGEIDADSAMRCRAACGAAARQAELHAAETKEG
jgi:hypothetical protein